MAYTGHGYHIPKTNRGEGVTRAVAPTGCGGPDKGCPRCKKDVADHMESIIGTGEDFQIKAKRLVKEYIDRIYTETGAEPPVYELYVPWFSKTLKNWKATVGTTLPDGLYFELTHNGEKNETYLDFYRKVENVVIKH